MRRGARVCHVPGSYCRLLYSAVSCAGQESAYTSSGLVRSGIVDRTKSSLARLHQTAHRTCVPTLAHNPKAACAVSQTIDAHVQFPCIQHAPPAPESCAVPPYSYSFPSPNGVSSMSGKFVSHIMSSQKLLRMVGSLPALAQVGVAGL